MLVVTCQIEEGEIAGSIASDGTVTFDDAVPDFNKVQVEHLLASAQQQRANLVAIDAKIARSREFLFKVPLILFWIEYLLILFQSLQRKEQGEWANIPDEDMFGKQSETAWAEEY